jgi:hypothetical protein
MKLSWRGGRSKGNESLLIAAAAPRSSGAIRQPVPAHGTTETPMLPRPAEPDSSNDVLLAGHLRRHGEAIAAFIARARHVSPAGAARPRAPGKWTPIQEALHLVLTYRAFTAVFAGAPEFTLVVPPEKAAHYHRTVLPRILAGDWFPSGAGAPDRTQPGERDLTMPAALGQLQAAADEFHTACAAAAVSDATRMWTHPYFGPTSIPDLVGVLTEHAKHHARFLSSSEAG